MPRPRSSLSLPDFPPPPPPPTTAALLPQSPPQQHQKSHSLNPSILIIVLILTLVFLVSASIHLLLRFFNRICHPSAPSSSSSPPPDDSHPPPILERHVPSEHQTLIDSLPIFSFDSVATAFQKSAPDCAVCLAKFDHQDQLRLLPNCCHAFHSRCIDAWLASNLTCPLCRSTVLVDESLVTHSSAGGESFRLEIGNISRREIGSGSQRSYSMGSFDYVVDDDIEAQVVVAPPAGHGRGGSDCVVKDKEEAPPPPGGDVAEAVGGRGWLKEYVDRLASSASSSFSSSRALSFRLSGRGGSATGTSRRIDGVPVSSGMSWDMDRAVRAGEEASHFFRWLTGV
ncbi:hypothetical protein MRB53_019296 [Persea americana]|uniref:Uncharacterized protein n=1 Tax=Persea americana TaxID=3435 RepID=A0ACC2KXP3_PERAE|nr:hypothetical protein MRB53_019296 [Persea americana]|eukprot:TRINITY_DN504_c0_g1_i1.p1 TRINITY_DN504_c0_g1~~TRINITY_DN504_c0_g1_i1.p1  ORF type:complete len:341 (-),score=53.35 TRINITY_DN504_c0_g1_i1:366-1388(-)